MTILPILHVLLLTIAILSGFAVAEAALAQPVGGIWPEVLTSKLITELIGLFVVATILESALATVFNWRLYREFFNGRAVKTLVMIGFSFAVVKLFNYDVVHRIIGYAGGTGERGFLSEALSALVLAGGSAAVYQLFRALGLRAPVEPDPERLQPPQDKAWASVRIIRRDAVGEVLIHFDPVANPDADVKARPAIAGVVGDGKSFGQRLRALFIADRMRLPSYGGRTVNADDTVYRIVASGKRRSAENNGQIVSFSEDIYIGRFAGRAIVDFVCTI